MSKEEFDQEVRTALYQWGWQRRENGHPCDTDKFKNNEAKRAFREGWGDCYAHEQSLDNMTGATNV